MEVKFYRCRHCGNIATKLTDSGIAMFCCGEEMKALVANTTDAAVEKHVPVVEKIDTGVKVVIGSNPHPMTEEHYIQWIYLETENGGQRRAFRPGDTPEATFCTDEDKPVAVYAYCNLHGLWKTEIK